ncbi:hypothetical protein L6164_015579 [Bauhinia variegata]|uniref:Uncharacterized protein n=1 Tax=Bauhinia variegata TaxID=167791 RepID=A0ACB9NQZ9_BAUVA|nr:hypothetical protein L6164_015579 [Bauhinia variegata]
MSLRRPAVNRSLNRENPNILIMMTAEKQIIRGGEEDKRDQREREELGPVKPAIQMSCTAARSNVFKFGFPLSPRLLVSLSPSLLFVLLSCGSSSSGCFSFISGTQA